MINKVILAGRIANDIDLKVLSEKLQIASFVLAVDRGKKKGAKESTVDFLRCKAFNRTATNVHSFCKKGSLICITGQVHNNRYEKNGEMKYSVEIITESIKFLPQLSSGNREKTPDETWDELSFDEKCLVINDYRARLKSKEQNENEQVAENVVEQSRTLETNAQPQPQSQTESHNSVHYTQRWSTELNKDEENIPKEVKEQAEEIVQEFSGGSSSQKIAVTTDSEQETSEAAEDSETNDASTEETSEQTDHDIMDKSLPF
ncbi:single-stranded DNA-binding protein [Macrococcus capreoli]